MKPECSQPECKGEHAVGAHELLGGIGASVNLIAWGDHETEEDEEWYVNIIRVEQAGESHPEFDDSWRELGGAESPPPPPEVGEVKEDRWWSPELQRPESEEEDEEENQYLISLLIGRARKGEQQQRISPATG
jgi:hypothetical protein